MAWEYPDSSLVAVCEFCHADLARYERSLLEEISPRDINNILDLAYVINRLKVRGISLKALVDQAYASLLKEQECEAKP